jgi:hypothetical protein
VIARVSCVNAYPTTASRSFHEKRYGMLHSILALVLPRSWLIVRTTLAWSAASLASRRYIHLQHRPLSHANRVRSVAGSQNWLRHTSYWRCQGLQLVRLHLQTSADPSTATVASGNGISQHGSTSCCIVFVREASNSGARLGWASAVTISRAADGWQEKDKQRMPCCTTNDSRVSWACTFCGSCSAS